MQIEKVNEPIEVLAMFRNHRTEPLSFQWGKKEIQIVKINLVHPEQDGREPVQIFSVSGEGAFYRLAYRPLASTWTLQEVWLE